MIDLVRAGRSPGRTRKASPVCFHSPR